jgi:hypothetical protein
VACSGIKEAFSMNREPPRLNGLPKSFQRASLTFVVLGLSLAASSLVSAGEGSLSCLPPVQPDATLPMDVLQIYRSELVVEFEIYFQEVSDFITCLDAERAAVLAEARAATNAYSELLDTPTKDEGE